MLNESTASAAELRRLLARIVRERPADGILLSAGLDTSALAALAHEGGCHPLAVTVCWDREAPDFAFAVELARRLGLEHHVIWADADALLGAMPEVVGVLRTFDPMELRNSAVQYVALRELARLGARTAWVGDAADELFAGYSYMAAMEPDELAAYTRELASFMRFSAAPLGRALGVEVISPYLDPDVVRHGVELNPHEKVGWRDGERHGKWVLRLAVQDLLPSHFVWRTKTPAEYGSGSTRLVGAVLDRLSEADFERIRREARDADGVRLRDREQAYYYGVFRTRFQAPRTRHGVPRCPECQAVLGSPRSRYCACCGAYPVEHPA